jgi:hypothetical protein
MKHNTEKYVSFAFGPVMPGTVYGIIAGLAVSFGFGVWTTPRASGWVSQDIGKLS